jgi:hypothetical protein
MGRKLPYGSYNHLFYLDVGAKGRRIK